MKKILDLANLTDEIAVVVGTRPGIIKFSPVIRALQNTGTPFFVIHTGQHYSYNMDKKFFEDLELPLPRFHNEKVAQEVYHGAQTALMICEVEQALLEAKPRVVIVGGDANTNLAGAIATRKLGITLAHMEAGLRSFDWQMPEEHNRVMIDHISEILLPPTPGAEKNLRDDNVRGDILMVGNPIVDAVLQNIQIAAKKSRVLETLGVQPRDYFLLTIHREENVDHDHILLKLLDNVRELIRELGTQVLFPIHPRTRKCLERLGQWEALNDVDKLRIIDPLGYLDFLVLIQNAEILMTDSGGIQEEGCILRVPCITLRENTERPETVDVGANRIAGTSSSALMDAVKHFRSIAHEWENPFGDGKAAYRIIDILKNYTGPVK